MGGQNAKQVKGQSSVQIDHPKFQNAKVLQQKGNILMQTTLSIQEKQYTKWKQQISMVKLNPDYLLMPRKHRFSTTGFCGSTGTLDVAYQYFPYLLMEEIQNRKKRKSKFQECELWYLLFSLSAAQIQMKKMFYSKVGDVRPENIFINQEGQIKVSCLLSWPNETSNFQKTFENQATLLAPQDMNKLQLGGMDDVKNYQSQMFSIGMTILGAALLTDFSDVYDVKKFKFKYGEASEYLNQWRMNTAYSEIFTAFVSNLCSFQPEKRLTQKQLWSWINKYEEQIKNKDDFVIQHAPLKIERQIQQLRGQQNINLLQQNRGPMEMMPPQNVSYQQRSTVLPFRQGQQQPRLMSQYPLHNVQRSVVSPGIQTNNTNMVMSPRQAIHYQNMQAMQSMHQNIQGSESMYTQMPPEIYQRQYANMPPNISQSLPPGVIPSRYMPVNGFLPQGVQTVYSPPQQNFMPPQNFSSLPSQNNGDFVYTRRIIDPNSKSVVAQELIGQDQYHRGMSVRNIEGDQQYEQQY